MSLTSYRAAPPRDLPQFHGLFQLSTSIKSGKEVRLTSVAHLIWFSRWLLRRLGLAGNQLRSCLPTLSTAIRFVEAGSEITQESACGPSSIHAKRLAGDVTAFRGGEE